MKSRIKELLYLIRTELRNRRTFFRDGSASNCSSNLKLLIAANTTAILFLIAFILVTPLIISSWHPTPYHLAFLPALLICFAVSLIYYRGHRNGGKGASLLCILLSIILLTFSVLLDTIGSAGAPAIFVPMMYVIVPVVFTLPFHISYGMIAITEIAYAFMLSTYKNNMTGRYDLFGSIVALACSLIIANIIMDLDNFKTLNDTKGHAAGDVLLKEIGRLLTEIFRRLDIIGRFGGDEFVILLKGTADPLLIRNKYTTIQERLKQLTQEQLDIPVTASFGSVYAEDQTVDAHLLFQQADTALYEAKRKEKSSCVIKKYQSET